MRPWDNWERIFYSKSRHLIKQRVNEALATGLDPNREGQRTGFTSLMLAVALKHDDRLDIAKMLISRGAEINKQCHEKDSTALHVAAYHGSLDCVTLLLHHNADPTLMDYQNRTPAQVAFSNLVDEVDPSREIIYRQCHEKLKSCADRVVRERLQKNATPEFQRHVLQSVLRNSRPNSDSRVDPRKNETPKERERHESSTYIYRPGMAKLEIINTPRRQVLEDNLFPSPRINKSRHASGISETNSPCHSPRPPRPQYKTPEVIMKSSSLEITAMTKPFQDENISPDKTQRSAMSDNNSMCLFEETAEVNLDSPKTPSDIQSPRSVREFATQTPPTQMADVEISSKKVGNPRQLFREKAIEKEGTPVPSSGSRSVSTIRRKPNFSTRSKPANLPKPKVPIGDEVTIIDDFDLSFQSKRSIFDNYYSQIEQEPKVELQTEVQSGSVKPETEAISKPEPDVEPKTEKDAEPKTEPDVEPKTEPVAVLKPEPETEFKPETEAVPKPKPKQSKKSEPLPEYSDPVTEPNIFEYFERSFQLPDMERIYLGSEINDDPNTFTLGNSPDHNIKETDSSSVYHNNATCALQSTCNISKSESTYSSFVFPDPPEFIQSIIIHPSPEKKNRKSRSLETSQDVEGLSTVLFERESPNSESLLPSIVPGSIIDLVNLPNKQPVSLMPISPTHASTQHIEESSCELTTSEGGESFHLDFSDCSLEKSIAIVDGEQVVARKIENLSVTVENEKVNTSCLSGIGIMNDTDLRKELKRFKVCVPPCITEGMRSRLKNKLRGLRTIGIEFSVELIDAINSVDIRAPPTGQNELRTLVSKESMTPGKDPKRFFNYLLLDPRKTRNLAKRYRDDPEMSSSQILRTFMKSIFYVGKGSGIRPHAHIKEAMTFSSKKAGFKMKLQVIKEIFASPRPAEIPPGEEPNFGILICEFSRNISNLQSLNQEAAMIEAINIDNLTNYKREKFSLPWTDRQVRQLGVDLLCAACRMYLLETEQFIYPSNV